MSWWPPALAYTSFVRVGDSFDTKPPCQSVNIKITWISDTSSLEEAEALHRRCPSVAAPLTKSIAERGPSGHH